MELSESSIIVMNPEGRFEKLPRGTRNCEVGEEILFAPVKRRLRIPQMAILSGLAAAIVLCFVLVSTLTGTIPGSQVVAYVTIDINPSVEIGIDNDEVVLDLKGLNQDGEDLIRTLVFKGKSLEAITSEILDKAEQGALAKGEGDIIISSTVVGQQTVVNDEAIAAKLKEQVSKHIVQTHPDQVKNYEVTAFAAPQEVRQEALASGVSAGKYAIYLNAVDNGAKVSLDDIKSVSIHQLAKDNGGIDKLVKPDKPIDKSSLQRLIADEKSGKLSEKIQQIQNEKLTKEKNNDNNGKNDKNNNNNKNGKNDNSGKTNVKPTTATPSKNDKNDNKNDKNGKNDNNNNNDDNKSTPRPDHRDDKNENDSKSSTKPRGTPKPVISGMPTVRPFIRPTPKSENDKSSDSRWNWGVRNTDSKNNNNDD